MITRAIPNRLLPVESEIMDYIEGNTGEAIDSYRARCGIPFMDYRDALSMFLDGLRQMELLKPGETRP